MPVEDDSHPWKVLGFRVHGLVRTMIMSLSTSEESLVTVAHMDGNNQDSDRERKARRLAVQNWTMGQGDPLLYTRPERLRSFNATGCIFSMELSLSRFKLLRVIAIEECTFLEGSSCDLKHLGKLHQLRYLGLYNTNIGKLPEDIGDLISLQTLDLRGTSVRELPLGVARLRQLRCLRADEGIAVGMGNLTSLEELRLGDVGMSGNFVEELGKLTELRELHIWVGRLDEKQRKALVQSMRKLEKIQVLRLMAHWSFGGQLIWGDYDPPRELHELHLSILSSRLPKWVNVSHVPILSHLYVHVMAVEDQDLDTLGALPELISLELVIWSNVFHSIKGDGAFPKLRRFHMSSTLRFLLGAMLRLEFLHFKVDVPALKDANVNFDDDFAASTLKNLPSLQKVEVEISSTGDVEAIHEALKRAVDEHPNSPSLQDYCNHAAGCRATSSVFELSSCLKG
ncbi:unnamed protein product [Triticum turgidum subsp. durum]|uniref:Disease resistance R13L4/SHOC-2-like LRR domain-containing protein n=1 Tax=Triticum turgidum subsp. durum TaxID=4567 RepID=A0A9R1RV83_TRITD|nr:unnamed protein product [Triticum turgidum subsp. durum]